MLSSLTHESNLYLTILSKLYTKYQRFPINPPISGLEISRLGAKSFSSGGFADCWKGVFLGQFDVVMKCPNKSMDGRIKRVSFSATVSLYHRAAANTAQNIAI